MAKQKFTDFVPREKPKKRPGRHTKSPNKKYTRKKYRGQGR
jgi:hypothetical protein|tara:strand:- start:931 stop:1053 length:123 start_codon:yes stop_codon:yes gene_type:complete